jgi:hypothetical protein
LQNFSVRVWFKISNSGVCATNHHRPAFAIRQHLQHSPPIKFQIETSATQPCRLLRNYRLDQKTQIHRRIEFNENQTLTEIHLKMLLGIGQNKRGLGGAHFLRLVTIHCSLISCKGSGAYKRTLQHF